MNSLPLLFKYHKNDNHLMELFEENSFYISTHKAFNDPFDCSFTIDSKFLYTLSSKNFTSKYLRSKLPFDQLIWYDNKIREMMKDDKYMNGLYKAMYKQQHDVGVCCFSETPKNNILWAYYTPSFYGVCLEFDFNVYDPLPDEFKLYKVDYSDELIQIMNGSIDETFKVLKSKKKCYSEEREWRIILLYSNKKLLFSKKILKAIYFGIRMEQKDVINIKNKTRVLGYNLNYFEMDINYKTKNIEFILSKNK